MASTLRLEVITPERCVLDRDVEMVILPGVEGSLGVLPHHAPLVSLLDIGIVRFGPREGEKERLALGGGFVEITGDKVTVLAETAELAEEIDVLRARAALERAQRRLEQRSEEIDYARARIALMKALTRLRVAGEDVE